MTATRHVVLIGLMASGKSTIGPRLAVRIGRPFLDNDVMLEARTGRSAREIAAADGADALHRQEADALIDALSASIPAVIAAAAAAPMEPDVAGALARHVVVYLRAAPAVLAARIERAPADDDHRPFVADDARAVLVEQFAARDGRYRELAGLTVDTEWGTTEAIVELIASALSAGLAP